MAAWLEPAIISGLAGTLLLALTYFYLYSREHQRFLLISGIGWGVFAFRRVFQLVGFHMQAPALLVSMTELASLWNGVLLYFGVNALADRKTSRVALASSLVVSGWILLAGAIGAPRSWSTIPSVIAPGVFYLLAGVRFLKLPGLDLGKRIVGWSFLLWGLHKFDYPFLVAHPVYGPVGYLVSAIFELTVAVGTLFVYFDKARNELSVNESRYRSLVEDSPVLIAGFGVGGVLGFVNRTFLQTFAEGGPALIGTNFYALLRGAAGRNVEAELQRLNPQSPVLALEVDCGFGLQKSRRIRWTIRAVYDERRELTGYQATGEDVTVQRAAEEESRQKDKLQALGRIAGGVAHDFNNQLAGIVGYSELLGRTPLDDEQKRYVDRILRCAEHGKNLVQMLLTFGRKSRFLPTTINVHEVIGEVTAILTHSIEKRIEIHQELTAKCPYVIADPTLLQNALLNLGLNARDAMPNGGDLRFSTRLVTTSELCGHIPGLAPGMYVEIAVSDTGGGIDEETREHLFEPFVTTKEGGSGLGLAAVYGAVKSHGGEITVDSARGRGTSFRIYLAATEAPPAVFVPRTEAKAGPTRATVLVVDDQDHVREATVELLEVLGCQTLAARDGFDAVKRYGEAWRKIDLVLLDLAMPRMSGTEAFRAIKAINPEVRVVFCSGFGIEHDVRILKEPGVFGHLQKPFTLPQLAEVLHQALPVQSFDTHSAQ